MKNNNRFIFHIDVNNAYLSWTAIYRLSKGETIDLRKIPSVIGGDQKDRRGVVLAKSTAAKKFDIKTGEPIFKARKKCPNIVVVPPCHKLYSQYSNTMVQLLKEYTSLVEKYSIDECFLDFTDIKDIDKIYFKIAYDIKNRIKRELGFTVNIGISNNKLLAKMASDFKKPDRIHTLFQKEIKEKMWPLPVEELFMVGKATAQKLYELNINTIGDLALYDIGVLRYKLKNYGEIIWNYANGIENSDIKKDTEEDIKAISNSTTTKVDVKDIKTARMVIISLCESVAMRLRKSGNCCRIISVSMKNSNFVSSSKQRKLLFSTDCTKEIIKVSCELFDELWKGESLRSIGIMLSDLCEGILEQVSLFEEKNIEKDRALDKVVDSIRTKYGKNSIIRSSFINSNLKPVNSSFIEGE